MRTLTAIILLLGVPLPYLAAATLTFDVASVKALPPVVASSGTAKKKQNSDAGASTGGPGTTDPGRLHYASVSLSALITRAYGVRRLSPLHAPPWMETDRFALEATMPPETTEDQLRVMLQNLLHDRFKLVIHRETKDVAGYTLVVAKNGPKLKESVPAPPRQETDAREPPPPLDADGFLAAPPRRNLGRPGQTGHYREGGWRVFFQQQTMEDLAGFLTVQTGGDPVQNDTRLSARYDFTLTFLPIDMPRIDFPNPPDIFTAVQAQLGLRLESRKVPVEMIVIDHVERTPTAN